jgi:hypothetical protein
VSATAVGSRSVLAALAAAALLALAWWRALA